ncbi:MAG: hypothetical protein V3V29_04505 [Acidimicrobiia bacterium]
MAFVAIVVTDLACGDDAGDTTTSYPFDDLGETTATDTTTATPETTATDTTTATPDTTAATTATTTQPSTAQDLPDPRAQVQSIDLIVVDGNLGVLVTFVQPWGTTPPVVFSLFFSLNILVDGESSVVGWQTHAGVPEPLSPLPLFLYDDGSVLAVTGIRLPSEFSGSVTVESGSWEDEATTQPVFATQSFPLDSSRLLPADALSSRTVVFDLLHYEEVAP